MKRSLFSLVSVALVLFACGKNARPVGEPCVVEGVTEGECETGALCAKDSTDILTCLKICDFGATQSDAGADSGTFADAGAASTCSSDQECVAVSNTTAKACRNKKK